jgi:hypothetical protein
VGKHDHPESTQFESRLVLLGWRWSRGPLHIARWVAFALTGVASCNPRNRIDTRATPRIVCDQADHDFGDALEGDRLTHAFRLGNAGAAPLQIRGVGRSYGCAAVNPPESISPGEFVDLRISCDTDGRQGKLLDRIVVRSDDPLAPELALRLESRVEPRLAFAERTIDMTLAFGETHSQDAQLTGRLAMKAHLEVKLVDPPGPAITVVPASDGSPPRLRLTVHAVRVGWVAGQVAVKTGLDTPPELTLLYTVRVLGNITVDPTNPVIDLYDTGQAGIVVRVSSRRNDFRLDDAEVIEGPFEATLARSEPSHGYTVQVRSVASRIPRGQRGLLGTLRLVSNDPAEPRKDVPLFALGGN